MNLLEIGDKVRLDLGRLLVSPKILCHRFRLLDEGSRMSSEFQDPAHVPAYYYLGKYFAPRSLFRYGFGLGLFTGSFLQSCSTVERLFAFRPAGSGDEVSSCKLGGKNLRDIYKGDLEIYAGPLSDGRVQERLAEGWECVMVRSEQGYDDIRYVLDTLWEHVLPGGVLVMDRASEEGAPSRAFRDFCQVKRLDPVVLETRYGTGLVTKEE